MCKHTRCGTIQESLFRTGEDAENAFKSATWKIWKYMVARRVLRIAYPCLVLIHRDCDGQKAGGKLEVSRSDMYGKLGVGRPDVVGEA